MVGYNTEFTLESPLYMKSHSPLGLTPSDSDLINLEQVPGTTMLFKFIKGIPICSQV